MKVDSKHIMPFIESIAALLNDYQASFPEMEEVETCEQTFDHVLDSLKKIFLTFKLEHLTEVLKPSERTLPSFVTTFNRQFDERLRSDQGNLNISAYEEKMEFMSKLYFHIKRKLENDGVDHLLQRDKIYHHIYIYHVSNDNNWGWYFKTAMAEPAYQVIDTVVDEIMENRRKHPQLQLILDPVKTNTSKKLIDTLGDL